MTLRSERCARRIVACLAIAAASALLARPAHAHPLAPTSWILHETSEGPAGSLRMTWRRPSVAPVGERLAPVLPSRCTVVAGSEHESRGPDAAVTTSRVVCGEGALAGRGGLRLAVSGLEGRDANVFVELALRDGQRFEGLLHANSPSIRFEDASTPRRATIPAFVALGVGHLLGGADHVLFVLGLVLLVSRLRALVWLVSSFTLGHSVSLALSATGAVRLPSALVEVLIALSLLWLALRVLDRRALLGETPPSGQRAALVCALFGLLHGLGFASAFAETGVSGAALPPALFGFNVGVELGQLAIVLPAAGLLGLLRARDARGGWEPRVLVLGAYGIGSASAYFVLDRAPTLALEIMRAVG